MGHFRASDFGAGPRFDGDVDDDVEDEETNDDELHNHAGAGGDGYEDSRHQQHDRCQHDR